MLKLDNAEQMLKSNLLIVGLVAVIGAMPLLTDLWSEPAVSQDYNGSSYDPSSQSSTVKTLGVIQNPNNGSGSASVGQNSQPMAGKEWSPSAQRQALDPDGPLSPVQVGSITYITGGIGDEERSELDQVKKDYNLHVLSASKDGAFTGDTHLVIRDAKGNQLINVSAGPLFYAQLPAGRYTVEVTREGEIKQESIHIGKHKPISTHFTW